MMVGASLEMSYIPLHMIKTGNVFKKTGQRYRSRASKKKEASLLDTACEGLILYFLSDGWTGRLEPGKDETGRRYYGVDCL
jgi:hypothetical protein